MICHDPPFLYVDICRTASTSGRSALTRVLGPRAESKHDHFRKIIEGGILTPEALDDYYTFVFVRNPYDRMVSYWTHPKFQGIPFPEFVRGLVAGEHRRLDIAAKDPCRQDIEYMPMVEWFTEGGRDWLGAVDFIGRFESLEADWRAVFRALQLPLFSTFPHENIAYAKREETRGHYSHYYTPEARRIVEAYYAADFEEFGYEWEEGQSPPVDSQER